METTLLSQPYSGNLLSKLTQEIQSDDYKKYNRLQVLVAYAKLSGVERLRQHLLGFRAAGGEVSVIVGIGQGNTSLEAVEQILKIADKSYVFHNPKAPSSTFHPKVFALSSKTEAWVSIGSSNLTYGGLVTNFEFNQLTQFGLAHAIDSESFKNLQAFFSTYAKSASSAQLTQPLIDTLHELGVLPSEQENREKIRREIKKGANKKLTELFGADTLPEPPSSAKNVGKKAKAALPPPIGFWKKLSNWDVSKKSSPGQIQIPIRFAPYFPQLGEPVVTDSDAEQADVYFDVLFLDDKGQAVEVKNTRLILYTPAAEHKRPNSEQRFTFRHRDGVFDLLGQGDMLEFRVSADPKYWFVIQLYKSNSAVTKSRKGDYGSLP